MAWRLATRRAPQTAARPSCAARTPARCRTARPAHGALHPFGAQVQVAHVAVVGEIDFGQCACFQGGLIIATSSAAGGLQAAQSPCVQANAPAHLQPGRAFALERPATHWPGWWMGRRSTGSPRARVMRAWRKLSPPLWAMARSRGRRAARPARSLTWAWRMLASRLPSRSHRHTHPTSRRRAPAATRYAFHSMLRRIGEGWRPNGFRMRQKWFCG
jgi:hypothetical protein